MRREGRAMVAVHGSFEGRECLCALRVTGEEKGAEIILERRVRD